MARRSEVSTRDVELTIMCGEHGAGLAHLVNGRDVEGATVDCVDEARTVALKVKGVVLARGLVDAANGTVSCWHESHIGGADKLSGMAIHN